MLVHDNNNSMLPTHYHIKNSSMHSRNGRLLAKGCNSSPYRPTAGVKVLFGHSETPTQPTGDRHCRIRILCCGQQRDRHGKSGPVEFPRIVEDQFRTLPVNRVTPDLTRGRLCTDAAIRTPKFEPSGLSLIVQRLKATIKRRRRVRVYNRTMLPRSMNKSYDEAGTSTEQEQLVIEPNKSLIMPDLNSRPQFYVESWVRQTRCRGEPRACAVHRTVINIPNIRALINRGEDRDEEKEKEKEKDCNV